MRHSALRSLPWLAPVIWIAACGGGDAASSPVTPQPQTPTPITPANPGPPASFTVQRGDGQTGEPGVALPVTPSVLVKDTAGRAVPGAAVSFVVDSGGGTIAAGQATTGTDGVATAGAWTLGRDEGRQTLRITVGALPLQRIAATAQVAAVDVAQASVSSSGGTLTVSRPGTALDGFSITVPDSAFSGSVSFTVRQSSSAGFEMPDPAAAPTIAALGTYNMRATMLPFSANAASGLQPATPLITIVSNGPASASGELLLRIPLPANVNNPVVAVVDSLGHPLSFLPIVVTDSVSVTVTTAALTPAVLQQIGNIPQTIPGGTRTLRVVIYKGRSGSLNVMYPYPITSRYQFGKHNFAFTDLGSSAMYRVGNGMMLAEYACIMYCSAGAYYGYSQTPNIPLSDSRGITLASGLTIDLTAALGRYGAAWIAYYRNQAVPTSKYDLAVANAVLATLWWTQAPVPLLLTDGTFLHAVLVIGWDPTNQRFVVREPGYSGATYLTYTNGNMNAYQDPLSNVRFTIAYFNWSWMMALWPRIYQQTALMTSGAGSYPGLLRAARVESWSPMLRGATPSDPDSIFLLGDTTRIWASTQSPPASVGGTLPVPVGSGAQNAWFYNSDGSTWTAQPVSHAASFAVDWTAYPNGAVGRAGLAIMERSVVPGVAEVWAGWREVRMVRYGVTISPDAQPAGTPSTFTPVVASSSPQPPTGAQYEWDFGDATAKLTTTGKSAVTHTYSTSGTYTIVLRVLHPTQGIAIATARNTVQTGNPNVWRITQLTTSSLAPIAGFHPANLPDQGGVTNSDHITWWKSDSTLLAQLSAFPARGLLVYLPIPQTIGGTTYRSGLYLQSDPTGTPGKSGAFDPTQTLIPLARTSAPPYPDVYPPGVLSEPYADTLTVSSSAFSGSSILQLRDFTGLAASLVQAQRKRTLLAWDVSATRNGTQLTATLHRSQPLWAYLPASAAHGMYYYGTNSTTISLTAVRVP